jgi:prophage regulatory protein
MVVQFRGKQEVKQERLLRLPQIIGNPKADPPIPPLIPVSKSCWWQGVSSGRFPQPVRLGPRLTCWLESDILALMEKGE